MYITQKIIWLQNGPMPMSTQKRSATIN